MLRRPALGIDPSRAVGRRRSRVGCRGTQVAEIDDAAGEAKAHTVRATCLARLGRIGECEIALDDALTAARRARDHRRVNAVLAGAPLAALWGPNPVPRAGGRCLDVVRLLRITTDSPAVEATSTRCQAVLEAFRGRDAAARRMIDSARRTVTELGLRHAFWRSNSSPASSSSSWRTGRGRAASSPGLQRFSPDGSGRRYRRDRCATRPRMSGARSGCRGRRIMHGE